MKRRIILASSSTWRRSLMADAGLDCEARSPGVDEELIVGPDAIATARARASAKAQAVADDALDALVIGADQVIHLDGESIGKPRNDQDWRAKLDRLRGRTHQLTTAVALVEAGETEVFHVTSDVRFRSDLSDAELNAYISTGEARGCAGGYMVERRGAWLVESVSGDWLNVIGLPVLQLISRLRSRGWRLEGKENA